MPPNKRLLISLGYWVFDMVRRRLAQDGDWKCQYCGLEVVVAPFAGARLATIDHKTPLSRGGCWKRFNLICACRGCNSDKGAMTFEEYVEYRRRMGLETYSRDFPGFPRATAMSKCSTSSRAPSFE